MKSVIGILAMILVTLMSGCQNNGHIGEIFGTWRVDSYMLDGVEQVKAVEGTTFSFQNNIVYVVVLLDEFQSHYERFGTWSEYGSDFTLDFTHSDNITSSGTGHYQAPEWLGMISTEPMAMIIDRPKSDEMILQWVDPNMAVHIYKLHKTW